MRLVIYGINFSPELTGIGKYTGEMAEWFSSRGYEVRVVTAPPYYPAWRISEGYFAYRYKREQHVDRLQVFRCPVWVPRKPNGFNRLVHLLSFAITSFPVIARQLFWKPDVMIAIEPPLFCAPAALLTARMCGAKGLLHIQDFEVDAAFNLGLLKFKWIRRIALVLERVILRRFDTVSTISNCMLDKVISKGVDPGKTLLFPNWADTEAVRPLSRPSKFRKEWCLDGKKVVLYSGNLGAKQGLELIVEAAQALSDREDVQFVIVGDGAYRAHLEAMASDLNSVSFYPLQPIDDLPDLLALADIHLVVQKREAADIVLPSKLTNILAAGGYSIITADTDTELGRLVTANEGLAKLVEPENVDAFIEVLREELDRVDSRPRSNSVARAYAEHFLAKDAILKRVDEHINSFAKADYRGAA